MPETWSTLKWLSGQMEDRGIPERKNNPEEIVAQLKQVVANPWCEVV
jgi:hypothetical protein